jgi:hypothetical protein
MPSKIRACENYREALTEAAASDTELPRELRLHVDACASCGAALEQERKLFSVIDAGLRTAANPEVPVSLLPRIRVHLDEAAARRFRWGGALIFGAASAVVVLTVFIALRPRRAIHGQEAQASSITSTPNVETPKMLTRSAANGLSTIAASARLHGIQQRKNSADVNPSAANAVEVIVPAEERDAFARFISSQSVRNDAPAIALAAVAAAEKKDEPMSLAPLQIAELEVRPLEALASEVPDGSEDRQ